MQNRIKTLLENKQDILSIYFTAGYPKLDDTVKVIEELVDAGVDLIEVGLPFSDPLADGPTIQKSGNIALDNGMTTKLLFEQLKEIRDKTDIPLVLMGNLNPVMQYGMDAFCKKCGEVGFDGIILPDLPVDVYESEYKELFERNGLSNIFLITPQTSEERIKYIDSISNGFIYMVSDSSITGATSGISDSQQAYFDRINNLGLTNPRLIGFGISTHQSFSTAVNSSSGAIIGSAFIKHLGEKGLDGVKDFVRMIRPHESA